MSLKEKAKRIKEDIPAIYLALKHHETPILAKITAGITIVYALSPIDLIPDFIPVLGLLDDLIILPLLIAITIKLIPKEELLICREQAKELWKDGKPQKWVYAIPFIIIWLCVLYFIMRIFI